MHLPSCSCNFNDVDVSQTCGWSQSPTDKTGQHIILSFFCLMKFTNNSMKISLGSRLLLTLPLALILFFICLLNCIDWVLSNVSSSVFPSGGPRDTSTNGPQSAYGKIK